MLHSYFTVAIRHLVKSKVFTAINVLGIAVALTASFFIVQFVAFESSFEMSYANRDRTYRISLQQIENGNVKNESAKNYPGIYDFVNESLPEVQAATRFVKIPANTGYLFGYHNRIYNERGGFINADSNLFNVFPELLLRGDAKTALKNPYSIVIAESVARKVFGDADPIGQQLDPVSERTGEALIVTGILRDMPANTHFHAKFVARIEDSWPEIIQNKWLPSMVYNYVALKQIASASVVVSKIDEMLARVSADVPDMKGSKVRLQPITDIHLTSHFSDEYEANGSTMLVYLMLAIGVVIMVMSWINYVNIETARFLKRAREVGVRRVIGSDKSDLLLQFLVEYCCITILALFVAGGMVVFVASPFTALTGIPIDLQMIARWDLIWATVAFFVVGTIIIGVYPSVYIVRMKPALALKGNFIRSTKSGVIKKPLLIVQFSASLFLIATLLVIEAQLEFMRVSDKKIEVDQVIAVNNPVAYAEQEVVDKYSNFRRLSNRLDQLAAVEAVETSSAIPGTEIGFTYVNLIKRTVNDPFDPTRYKVIFVGNNFLPLYGVRLLAGRNFGMEDGGTWIEPWERKDWYKVIINEKAAKILGFNSPQEAVNQVVKFQVFDEFEDHEIIGVIEDYHHEAIRKETYPIVLKTNFNSYQQVYYSIRLRPEVSPRQAISDIESAWKQVFPEYPFDYFFLDDYYDQQFKSELQISTVFSFFAGVAIFIGCLGVLGMVMFESGARIKEISIRKVLGASAAGLLALLSKEQLKCLIISCVVTVPAAWYAAEMYLGTYPSRIGLSVFMFALPVIIISILVWLISCLQALRAVLANPAQHLKNE